MLKNFLWSFLFIVFCVEVESYCNSLLRESVCLHEIACVWGTTDKICHLDAACFFTGYKNFLLCPQGCAGIQVVTGNGALCFNKTYHVDASKGGQGSCASLDWLVWGGDCIASDCQKYGDDVCLEKGLINTREETPPEEPAEDEKNPEDKKKKKKTMTIVIVVIVVFVVVCAIGIIITICVVTRKKPPRINSAPLPSSSQQNSNSVVHPPPDYNPSDSHYPPPDYAFPQQPPGCPYIPPGYSYPPQSSGYSHPYSDIGYPPPAAVAFPCLPDYQEQNQSSLQNGGAAAGMATTTNASASVQNKRVINVDGAIDGGGGDSYDRWEAYQ